MENYYPCLWVQAQGNSKQDALKTVQRVVNKILVKGQATFVYISKAIFLILDAIIFKHTTEALLSLKGNILLLTKRKKRIRFFDELCMYARDSMGIVERP